MAFSVGTGRGCIQDFLGRDRDRVFTGFSAYGVYRDILVGTGTGCIQGFMGRDRAECICTATLLIGSGTGYIHGFLGRDWERVYTGISC